MMVRLRPVILIALACFVLILSACTPKGAKLKDELLGALERQSEVTSYRFHGKAELSLPLAPSSDDETTASLQTSLLQGAYTWSGTADLKQERIQLDLGIAPAESDVSFRFPLQLANHKLYFKAPMLNPEQSDFAFALPAQADQGIAGMSELYLGLLRTAVEPLDADFFEAPDEDSSSYKRVEIPVKQDNVLQLLLALQPQLEPLMEKLQDAGLVDAEQAASWLDTAASEETREKVKEIEIVEPGGFTFVLDKEGYIVSYEFKLHYRFGEDGVPWKLHYTHQLEDLNGNPDMTIEIPENVTVINELLSQWLEPPIEADQEDQ